MTMFTMQIDCDNAAFGENWPNLIAEVARVLRDTAMRLEAVGSPVNYTVRDINGNRVGWFRFDEHDGLTIDDAA